MNVQDTADRIAILDLIARYSHYIDNEQYDEWIGLFTDDGVFLNPTGEESREPGKLRDFCKTYAEVRKPFPFVRHVQNSTMIDVDGDQARASSYLQAFFTVDGAVKTHTTGVYHDKLVKIDGRWLIKERYLEKDTPEGSEAHKREPR